jgi:glycosyltransferase involved in cell wall biosynthesis
MEGKGGDVVVAVYVKGDGHTFGPTLRSLAEHLEGPVVVGGRELDVATLPEGLYADALPGVTPAALVEETWRRHGTDVLVVSDAVMVPPGFLERARGIVEQDVRAATVSFFSNAAAYLSFPVPNKPVDRPLSGDEISITRRLRSTSPAPNPVPIPVAAGACVLLTSAALSILGPPSDGPGGSVAEMVQDFCLEARRRGFLSYLDASTYCARPSDLSVEPIEVLVDGTVVGPWAAGRHPFAAHLLDVESGRETPLDVAFHGARAKFEGLCLLIDGACFGPHEMGTQVGTLSLIRALAQRDDVSEIRIVSKDVVPAYARDVFADPKIRFLKPDQLAPLLQADIAHRPYQPEPLFRPEPFRWSARRTLVSILDLIAYQIGSYHKSPEEWLRYRASMQRTLGLMDGVIANSRDVRRHIELECLPVEPSRLWVVPPGTDHLTGEEPARMPPELASRGFASEEFVLVIGANYSHKNRDLAIQAHREMRRRRPGLALVLAGARVPHGSSRLSEERWMPADGVFDVPGVTSEERNWLERHAAVVLYPTSAEGFGLIPFEAARLGTPTVYVSFGSLREAAGHPPVAPSDWDPRRLAAAVEALLDDPELARAQVAAALAAGEKYTWRQAAADLVEIYRELLARPVPATALATAL